MSGFWQGARNFFTGKAAETTTPALTPEGEALGFEWESSAKQQDFALLWPHGGPVRKRTIEHAKEGVEFVAT